MMGVFNPGLLWFALGGLVPVVLHLLYRQKYRRVRWAAMEFLLAALKKTQRRLRLENLLLLLLRILVMVLLAAALARPFFQEAPLAILGQSDTHHVFVVDVSYSMAYRTGQRSCMDIAREAAEKVLEGIHAGEQDRFSLVTLSTWPETVRRHLTRKEPLRAALQDLAPSDYGTRMDATLLEVRQLLETTKNRDRRVYVFTDLQRNAWEFRDEIEGARFAGLLKDLSNAPYTRVAIFDTGLPDPLNRALVGLRVEDPVATPQRRTRFAAEMHNYSPLPAGPVRVGFYVQEALVDSKEVTLPPQATVPVSFEYHFTSAGPHLARASLDPDYLDVDDSRWLALEVRPALNALVVDGEPGGSPSEGETYAFALALDPAGSGRTFSVTAKTPEFFSAEGLDSWDFLVLANVPGLPADKVRKIEDFVRRGGGLLIALGDRVGQASFNDTLWKAGQGLSPAAIEEISGIAPEGRDGVERRIAKFSPDHPVFRTFRDKLRAAIFDLVFYKYWTVSGFAPEGVLARFEDPSESPVLLEKQFGEGKVLLMTTALDDEWNGGIVGHPPYLCLAWDIGRYLSTRSPRPRNLYVGDLIQLELPVEQYQPPFLLDTPSDGRVTLPAAAPEREQKFFRLFYPARSKSADPKVLINEGLRHAGPYRLTRRAGELEQTAAHFAVNVPPRSLLPEEIQAAEGNLDRISSDEIRRRFPDFKVDFPGEKGSGVPGDMAERPPGGNVWKFLLYGVFGLLVAESAMAWLFGRVRQ